LILDLRHHHGGELREMDVIFADLFGATTDLLTMTTRPAAWERFEKKPPTEQLSVVARDETMVREMHRAVPRVGGARMANVPVYVLTSRGTASAGEHLALAMKVSGRGLLVGDKTRGAGHYGDAVELADGYSMFIPYGDTVDPRSGKGWEADGVAPDVAVPARDALDYVLEKLGAPKASAPYPAV
jgi:C-terminal processing protease CtpA/Prc